MFYALIFPCKCHAVTSVEEAQNPFRFLMPDQLNGFIYINIPFDDPKESIICYKE